MASFQASEYCHPSRFVNWISPSIFTIYIYISRLFSTKIIHLSYGCWVMSKAVEALTKIWTTQQDGHQRSECISMILFFIFSQKYAYVQVHIYIYIYESLCICTRYHHYHLIVVTVYERLTFCVAWHGLRTWQWTPSKWWWSWRSPWSPTMMPGVAVRWWWMLRCYFV